MKMLLHVKFPNEQFSSFVKDGTVGTKIRRILEELKPEGAYFTETDGHRGAIMIVDVPDASKIPALAEPWFLAFNATCELRIAMTPEDLGKSGIDAIGKKWS